MAEGFSATSSPGPAQPGGLGCCRTQDPGCPQALVHPPALRPQGPEASGKKATNAPRPLCRGDSWELTVGGAQPLTPLGFSRSLRVRAHGPYNNMRNLKNKLGP